MGFIETRSQGSHFTLYHPDTRAICTVPVHAGATLAPKTLQSILKQAEISVEELLKKL